MKTIYQLMLLFFSLTNLAQSESLNGTKYQFAPDVFKNSYTKGSFKKFTGKIEIKNDNSNQFDEKTLLLENVAEQYKSIFLSGIFYPNIITGNYIAEIKTKDELDLMTTKEKVFYNMMRTDSLKIGYFDELKLINPNPKLKRFVFWLFTKGRANATECYFELENAEANKKTPLSEFIKNSTLTFYYRGTLII